MEAFSTGEMVILLPEDKVPTRIQEYFELIKLLKNFHAEHGYGPFEVISAKPTEASLQRADHPQDIIIKTPSGTWGASGWWFKKYKS